MQNKSAHQGDYNSAHLCAMATEMKDQDVAGLAGADEALQRLLDLLASRLRSTLLSVYQHCDILAVEAEAIKEHLLDCVGVIDAAAQLRLGACTYTRLLEETQARFTSRTPKVNDTNTAYDSCCI